MEQVPKKVVTGVTFRNTHGKPIGEVTPVQSQDMPSEKLLRVFLTVLGDLISILLPARDF